VKDKSDGMMLLSSGTYDVEEREGKECEDKVVADPIIILSVAQTDTDLRRFASRGFGLSPGPGVREKFMRGNNQQTAMHFLKSEIPPHT
jgi:hypothetical protein